MAAFLFAGCNKECEMPDSKVVGDGNSIILNLSSGSLPVSRAVETTAAEVKVSHIDVLIFDENGKKEWYERVGGSETGSGTIALGAKRSDFTRDAKYWVYLIANSTEKEEVFRAEGFNRNSLLSMRQEDPDIHMTGLTNLDVPQTFLMDGVAYPDNGQAEPPQRTTVVLNNGVKSDDTKLKVTLRRAAAKLVIRIHKGQFVEFDNSPAAHGAGYYLRNMPYSTSVVAAAKGDVKLRTPDLNSNSYFNWTEEVITVTAYAYAHEWENASSLEKEVRLIVNIPMYYIPHDENNQPTGDPKVFHESSYYQIPVCSGKELKRNTCYEVSLTLNVPGGTNPLEPVKLEADYIVLSPWENKLINIGGEDDLPEYLTLNEEEFEMHNINDDHTTLQFTSSSAVKAEITRVYYIDKFGEPQELIRIPNTDNEWGVRSGSGWQQTWANQCTIKITPDAGINGKIDVFGDVPQNNAVRYVEFTVTNATGQKRNVVVAQYPLEYITNVVGWYSTRSDFGGTTYESPGNRNVAAESYNSSRDTWGYSKNNTDAFFSAKYVDRNSNGTSDIHYYRWVTKNGNNTNSVQDAGNSNNSNSRMYHVQITASSGTYTLGKPRLTKEGITDPGKDNAELVSPSFMIASQLGAVYSSNLGSNYEKGIAMAASHCKEYVEVAKDGTVYDDWRLPTKAEIEIIARFQRVKGSAVDVVLAGESYYSASEIVDLGQGNDGAFLRCIRDAYNDKKTAHQ